MATRRSARITALSEASLVTPSRTTRNLKGSATLAQSAQRQSQARKKQKLVATPTKDGVAVQSNKNGKGKRRAESQSCLTEMPLDVLLEIFSQLEPIDLYHLLRVSKEIYDFLWLNTSTHIWELAYKNLFGVQRPPPCPPGVNIIHYTNFLFGTHCQFCNSGAQQEKHLTALVRLCLKCIKKQTIRAQHHTLDGRVHRLCHSWLLRDSGNRILTVEYELRQQEMTQAFKEQTVSEYVNQRTEVVRYRLQQANGLKDWWSRLAQHAREERDRIKNHRRHAICTRLMNEVIIPPSVFWQLFNMPFPQENEAHELSDDEWIHIRADVIECLFDTAEKGLRDPIDTDIRQKIARLECYLRNSTASRPRILPAVSYIASSAPYLNSIKSYGRQTLDNLLLTNTHQRAIKNWRQKTDVYLESFIPKTRRRPRISSLELATTFFRCYKCSEPISYPRILMHHCFMLPSTVASDYDNQAVPGQPRQLKVTNTDTVFASLMEERGEGMHPGRAGIAFHKTASQLARSIVQVCGESPDTITYAKMDEKDVRVECLLCRLSTKNKDQRLVMRWTIAEILHDLDEHSEELSLQPHWRLVTSHEELDTIKKKESQMVKRYDMPCLYCCRRCDQPVKRDLIRHLRVCCSFIGTEFQVSQYFYPNIDVTMAVPPFGVRI